MSCKLCKENHKINSCNKFLNMDYFSRVSTLKKFRYCFNCLKIGHMYGDCNSPNNCSKCKKKHHTLMHRDFTKKEIQIQTNNAPQIENKDRTIQTNTDELPGPSGIVQAHHTSASKKVMLATAWMNIISFGSTYKVRALIDPCSDESFVSEKIQKLLKLPISPISAEITGLGGRVISKCGKMANFKVVSLFDQNMTLNIQALVVSHVTGNIPTHTFRPLSKFNLPKLNYADPEFYKSSEIDLLLGGDLYPLILRGCVKHNIYETLVAQETIFGWIVTCPTSNINLCQSVSYVTNVSINEQLAKFWELEVVSKKQYFSENDKKCEEIYTSTTTKNSEGKYILCLPFKNDVNLLGSNRNIAMSQFLKKRKIINKFS